MASLLLKLCTLIQQLRHAHKLAQVDPAHQRRRYVTSWAVAKCLCDLGQAVPDALALDTHPLVESLLGFSSSVIGTYLCYLNSTAPRVNGDSDSECETESDLE